MFDKVFNFLKVQLHGKETPGWINDYLENCESDVSDDVRRVALECLDNCIATVNRDEHRWYTRATEVYQLGERFIGINKAVDWKCEERDEEGPCYVYEMEAIPSITYVKKGV